MDIAYRIKVTCYQKFTVTLAECPVAGETASFYWLRFPEDISKTHAVFKHIFITDYDSAKGLFLRNHRHNVRYSYFWFTDRSLAVKFGNEIKANGKIWEYEALLERKLRIRDNVDRDVERIRGILEGLRNEQGRQG